jgi:hypothetical protein
MGMVVCGLLEKIYAGLFLPDWLSDDGPGP